MAVAENRIGCRIFAPRDCQLRTSSSACSPFDLALVTKLNEQRPGVLQVGGVEALGEPVVDFGEHRASFVAVAVRSPHGAHLRTQFKLLF